MGSKKRLALVKKLDPSLDEKLALVVASAPKTAIVLDDESREAILPVLLQIRVRRCEGWMTRQFYSNCIKLFCSCRNQTTKRLIADAFSSGDAITRESLILDLYYLSKLSPGLSVSTAKASITGIIKLLLCEDKIILQYVNKYLKNVVPLIAMDLFRAVRGTEIPDSVRSKVDDIIIAHDPDVLESLHYKMRFEDNIESLLKSKQNLVTVRIFYEIGLAYDKGASSQAQVSKIIAERIENIKLLSNLRTDGSASTISKYFGYIENLFGPTFGPIFRRSTTGLKPIIGLTEGGKSAWKLVDQFLEGFKLKGM